MCKRNATFFLFPFSFLLVLMLPAALAAQPQRPGPRQAGREVQFAARGVQPRSRPALEGVRITKPSRTITPPRKRGDEKRRTSAGFATTLGALSLIVVVILIAARLWTKYGPMPNAGLPKEAIEILGKRYVEGRQTIHLVRLGSRILVLGSSSNGLQTLAEVTDPVEVDYLAGLCRRSDNSVAYSFRTIFKKAVAGADHVPAETDVELHASPPAASPPAGPVLGEPFQLDSPLRSDSSLEGVHG